MRHVRSRSECEVRSACYQWPCGLDASGSYAAHTGRTLADDPLPAVAILNALLFHAPAPAAWGTLDEEDAAPAVAASGGAGGVDEGGADADGALRRQSLLDPGFEAPAAGGVALQGNAGDYYDSLNSSIAHLLARRKVRRCRLTL